MLFVPNLMKPGGDGWDNLSKISVYQDLWQNGEQLLVLQSVQAIEPLKIPKAPNDSFDELLCRILSGSEDAEINSFHAISDLYGFNQEERDRLV